MSYEIVKKIEINKDEKRVYITSCSNNVSPRTPSRWPCTYYDKLANLGAWEEIELDILAAYDSGNFQGAANKYTRALTVLRRMPEYPKFDWRQNCWDEYTKNKEAKKDEYRGLLKKAFATKLPSEKFIISKDCSGRTVYLSKRKNAHFARWYNDRTKATKFNFQDDAEFIKKCFTGSDEWKVEKF